MKLENRVKKRNSRGRMYVTWQSQDHRQSNALKFPAFQNLCFTFELVINNDKRSYKVFIAKIIKFGDNLFITTIIYDLSIPFA